MGEKHSSDPDDRYFFLDNQEVVVIDFEASRFILDIGGGGEGIIGQLKGRQVVAIDSNRRELEEAATGPLKIVMDARELLFLTGSFEIATSFFALMYIQTADHKRVFEEVFRVLEPEGRFLIWDVKFPPRLADDKDIAAFYLRVKLPDRQVETGYGTKWPEQILNLSYYQELAEEVGFRISEQSENGQVFYLELQKP
jgi:ubiquinone/menaquinone biosynthesis C-methylase UbiE